MPLIRKPAGPAQAATPAPDAAAVLRQLVDGTDEQRWSAARAAADLPASVAALGAALAHETTPRVREAIFTSLARIATPPAVDIVLQFLRSDDAHTRTEATDALAAMKDAAWPAVTQLLRDPDADLRVLVCGLVRNMPNDLAERLLCDVLDSDAEPNVCGAAIDALAEIGGPEALPALERCRQRFQATPFLVFAIKIAADRIRAQSSQPRA